MKNLKACSFGFLRKERINMKFGYFDDKNLEYVITDPKTPYPWINYLGCENYFSLISNTAGGYAFYRDARLRRITRYRYNNVPVDMGGRYYYINDGGKVWCPSWSPVKASLDNYSCRHGMGYTVISGEKNGIKCETTFFVPIGADCEIHRMKLTNTSSQHKDFRLYSLIEWCLWDANDDSTNFQRNFNTGEVEIEGSAIYHKTEYRERRDHFAFYTVNADVSGYDTDRESFMGLYNGFDRPDAVFENSPRNSVADGWSPIASHCLDISLESGESRELIFILGYVENPFEEKFNPDGTINKIRAYELISRFDSTEKADAALCELKEYWQKLLSKYTVSSPDDKLNRMVNIWNQYQCMVTFNLSRSASYFESGIGRGMGFRDSNQDILGFVHQIPDRARERLIDLASTQMPDGTCYHQYQPLTKKGNGEVGGNFSDDPLWMILSVCAYIKETGDYTILDESVPYDNDPALAQPMSHHLKMSFLRVMNTLGPHGLPLIQRADWNDCLNLNCFSSVSGESFQTTTSKDGKVAESVFVACLFTYVVPEYARLCHIRGLEADAAEAEAAVAQMSAAVMKYGWDGEWFLRAYDDFGRKVGSAECEEGKIFIEPQGFAVLSGLGSDSGKDLRALSSVDKYLNCKHGLVLNNSPYSRYYVEYGEISTYPGGYKENAGIFCHNNAWIICAEAFVGHGDKAFEYYSKIAPAYNEDISEIHRTEPYVYAQMIAGKDAKRFGEAKNSWLTGTAAWNFVAVSQYILGIMPDYDGLKIDPSIPSDWDGFSAQRIYRGAKYNITVKNPEHISKGVRSIICDGVKLGENILPVFEAGSEHEVEVVLGQD